MPARRRGCRRVDGERALRLGDMSGCNAGRGSADFWNWARKTRGPGGRLRLRASWRPGLSQQDESKRDKRRVIRSGGSPDPSIGSRPASPGLELDLRGQTVEDAIPALEDYLDAAYMAGLPFVRIIHGKGTGALRQAVRERLNGHPLIKKYARGDEKEGGDGVTVVSLVPSS